MGYFLGGHNVFVARRLHINVLDRVERIVECSSSTPWTSQDITRDEVMTSTPFLASVHRT
jgi:hypothetical protein